MRRNRDLTWPNLSVEPGVASLHRKSRLRACKEQHNGLVISGSSMA
jgi:hypothetical protein